MSHVFPEFKTTQKAYENYIWEVKQMKPKNYSLTYSDKKREKVESE